MIFSVNRFSIDASDSADGRLATAICAAVFLARASSRAFLSIAFSAADAASAAATATSTFFSIQ